MLPDSVRIFITVDPADLRKGFGSLCSLVRQMSSDGNSYEVK